MLVHDAVDLFESWSVDPRCCAVLFGAGVSMDAPCCMPSGSALSNAILESSFGAEPGLLETLRPFVDPLRLGRRDPEDYLRMERVLQVHHDTGEGALTGLNYFCDYFPPNSNHYLLAVLAAAGCALITTNFDRQVEYAASQLRVRLARVASEREYQDVETVQLPSCVLLKAHGDALMDASGVEGGGTIAATLSTLDAKDRSAQSKWRALERVLKSRDLVVVGYSGADDLDLMPLLTHLDCSHRVLWVQHRALPETRVSAIAELEASPKDASGKMLDPAIACVLALHRKRGNAVQYAHATTSDVLRSLAKRVGAENTSLIDAAHQCLAEFESRAGTLHSASERRLRHHWERALSPFRERGWLLGADLLLSIARKHEAEAVIDRRLARADSAQRAALTADAARLFRRYGYPSVARHLLANEVERTRSAGAESSCAVLEAERVFVDSGTSYVRTSYWDHVRDGAGEHPAAYVNNEGLARLRIGDHAGARACFERANEICSTLRDRDGAAAMIGQTALTYADEDSKRYVELSALALAHFEGRGLLQLEVEYRVQLGVALLQAGRGDAGKRELRRARKQAKRIRSLDDLAQCHSGLGFVLFGEGHRDASALHLHIVVLMAERGVARDKRALPGIAEHLLVLAGVSPAHHARCERIACAYLERICAPTHKASPGSGTTRDAR